MLFEIGKTYKHKLMVDVVFTIKNLRRVNEGTLLLVRWYNTKYKHYVDIVDRILVLDKQLDNYAEHALRETILRKKSKPGTSNIT